MSDYIQVTTTVAQKEQAQAIAEALLESRLAACVQIVGPITSMYWWEDDIDKSSEYLCIIKTRQEKYDQVEKAIRAAHSYEVPEILALLITAGSKDYLTWLDTELKKK
ncbi:MAG: divalent-cation tolerance protein CutA [Desulfobacteraceae bacterium]|nr:divalent-cation tolerance protein CutA [Desulfobacteraceae bacterium]